MAPRHRLETPHHRNAPAGQRPQRQERTLGEDEHHREEAGRAVRAAPAPDELPPIAAAVRGALKKAARERTHLLEQASAAARQRGSALPQLHREDRIEVMPLIRNNKIS
jgi:hypothetical protein